MEYVSLELFKQHIRADEFAGDDDYMAHLIAAATEAVITATQAGEAALVEAGGGTLPAGLVQAILMLAAHWYNQRESVSTGQMQEVPDALQSLIKPWRVLVHTSEGEN